MDPVTGTLISGGIKLLGGLFGKKKAPTPADNMLSQAKGARQAAEKYGFNPLTMLQYGQTGGSMGGGTPPLANADLLMGALQDVSDVVTGETARREAANQLELDLGKLKLDQLRGGVLAVAPSATATVGDGLPPLGRRAATVVTSNVGPVAAGRFADERLNDPVRLEGGKSGGIAIPDGRLDRGSGIYVGGLRVDAAPGWSPASVIEEEYGDVGSAVYGFGKMIADAGYTHRDMLREWGRATESAIKDGVATLGSFVAPPPYDLWLPPSHVG